ncbi:MAG: response regulator [Desulfovibrio sp.]|jgi:signal transduction histidine kinase/CheY-like chemotaxis protein/HPt (histidine-containing phosphotransfer) domain-containing protein|nr:response regulator [Desulfovibrio sp.]
MPLKHLLHIARFKLLLVFILTALSAACSYYMISRNITAHRDRDVYATLNVTKHALAARLQTLTYELDVIALILRERLEQSASMENLRALAANLHEKVASPDIGSPIQPFDFTAHIDGEDLSHQNSVCSVPLLNLPTTLQPWYILAVLNPDKFITTDPVLCPQTRKLTFFISRAVQDSSGRVRGAAAFAVPVASFFSKIYQEADGGFVVLTTADYTIMVHHNRELLGRKLQTITDDYANLVEKLQSGATVQMPVTLPNYRGVRSMLFLQETFNGWHVGFLTTEQAYRRDISTMAFILLFGGIATFLVTAYFILRLSAEKYRSDSENKTKTLFLARMSHEIRTPLNSILGFTELLARKHISREMREYTNIIGQAGNSLLAIISDILDFSKIESGSFALEQYDYHFSSLLNDIINMVRIPMLEKHDINFIVRINPEIPAILHGDEVRVRQIFYNLLSNAIKYTEKGFIQLSVGIEEFHEDSILLSVQVMDTGVGINENDIKFIFDDFRRSTSKEHIHIEGTGLGLAITWNLCNMMDGTINVKSKYKKGSTFTATIRQHFYDKTPTAHIATASQIRILMLSDNSIDMLSLELALNDLGVEHIYNASGVQEFTESLQNNDYDYAFVTSRQARHCIPHKASETDSPRFIVVGKIGEDVPRNAESLISPPYSLTVADVLNGRTGRNAPDVETSMDLSAPTAKVLVVDDIYANLMVAKEFIAHFDIRTDTCTNGREAVQLVMENRYDIVFMDHMMPDMDGMEAAAAIRQAGEENENCRDTVIIALTANAVSGQREVFLAGGMNDFLPKPVRMNKLADMLKKWLPLEKQVYRPMRENQQKGTVMLKEIEGINFRAGLLNAGENPNVYLDILIEFCRDGKLKIPQILESLENGDIKNYTILVHALKGTCRTTGALQTAHLAAKLESAARKGDTAFMLDNTAPFIENLDTLLHNIQRALLLEQKDIVYESIDIRVFEFDVLKKALQDMEIQTVNFLLQKYASMHLNREQKELIAEIERCITAFEYEEAIEKINAAVRS